VFDFFPLLHEFRILQTPYNPYLKPFGDSTSWFGTFRGFNTLIWNLPKKKTHQESCGSLGALVKYAYTKDT
jgi:hypothetical protein